MEEAWLRKRFGGPDEAARLFEEQRQRQLVQEQQQGASAIVAAHQEDMRVYKFEFGQFKRKTIREVVDLGETEAKHKDYIPWLICSGMHLRYSAFAAGLRDEGLCVRFL